MLVNSSSSSNSSLALSSTVSLYRDLHYCFISKVGTFSITALTIARISVILPLCLLVLYLGHQRWQQQRSGTRISHSDLFTYHMVVAELLSVLGATLICCGVHSNLHEMLGVGLYLYSMNLSAQLFFHLLTCVERYLAVVHPITYLSLRKAKWIRIRNITIVCIWLLCVVGTGLLAMVGEVPNIITYFCLIAIFLIVTSFCSISVLCVLIRPGPGEGVGGRYQIDQTKLRAFNTIMVILGVLLFRFGGDLLSIALYASSQLEYGKCGIFLAVYWFCLPSSLVLPLLFLQRAGKLMCCKNKKESGQVPD